PAGRLRPVLAARARRLLRRGRGHDHQRPPGVDGPRARPVGGGQGDRRPRLLQGRPVDGALRPDLQPQGLPDAHAGGGVVSDADRPRVFGIGLNKTGTSSLHAALELLGYNALHFGGIETMNAVQRAIVGGESMLSHLDPAVDAFTDVFGITYCFYLADVQYPGSKFILTVRDLDAWLDSRRRHVERNQELTAAGRYEDGFVRVDLEGWA